jgi:regulatory protein YycI of two-component signal transduction system YycFG
MKKVKYGLLITTLVLISVFAFTACSSSDEKVSIDQHSTDMPMNMNHNNGEMDHKDDEMGHGDSKDKTAKSVDFSSQKNEQTSAIIDAYEQTKSALDANDKAKTAEGAKAMLAAFKKFDSSKISEDKQKEFAEIEESAKEHAEHIIKSDLDHQKEHFESLTTDIKDLFALTNTDKK